MEKILCSITSAEADEYILLLQNIASCQTLLCIKKEQERLTATQRQEIMNNIRLIEDKKNIWWESITRKYNIPFYHNKKMQINAQHLYIYIEE